jgi:tetratricopeptide (TPR) repeat protein
MRADLLTPASPAIYKQLLAAGKHPAEANEGLAVLAIRNNDVAGARTYMSTARKSGTKNFVALTAYAELEKDPAEGIDILKEALTIDPKYAKAHWVLGEKITEPARRAAEWKQAVNLAPRNTDWWAQYAKLCVDLKQYAEAGRAWVSAAQSTADVQRREQYLTARSQIDQLRLADEDAERRKETEAKAREIDRLKTDARRELAELEARVNTRPLSREEASKTVDWIETDKEDKVTGTLVRVDCMGKQLRLNVKDDAGKTQALLVSDPAHLFVDAGQQASQTTLSCGVQKPRRVTVTYRAAKSKAGLAGEATGLEFQ